MGQCGACGCIPSLWQEWGYQGQWKWQLVQQSVHKCIYAEGRTHLYNYSITCSCSIHSLYIGAPLDNRSAPVFRIPGRWITLMERNGPLHQRISFCARVCNTPERKPLDGLYTLLLLRCPPSPGRGGPRGMGASVSATESSRKFVKTLKSWALASSRSTTLVDASSAQKAGICGNHFSGRDNAHGYPESRKTGHASDVGMSCNPLLPRCPMHHDTKDPALVRRSKWECGNMCFSDPQTKNNCSVFLDAAVLFVSESWTYIST